MVVEIVSLSTVAGKGRPLGYGLIYYLHDQALRQGAYCLANSLL